MFFITHKIWLNRYRCRIYCVKNTKKKLKKSKYFCIFCELNPTYIEQLYNFLEKIMETMGKWLTPEEGGYVPADGRFFTSMIGELNK